MRVLRIVCGTLLFCIALCGVNSVLSRKSSYVDSIRDFFSSSTPDVDVIGFGSSHMYCTLNPVALYRSEGVRSYVLATQQQPPELTVEYIRRALKTHRPRVALLETLMFFQSARPTAISDAVAHNSLDPIPFGVDKCLTVMGLPNAKDIDSLMLPFIKYHSRWKELGRRDWSPGMPSASEESIMGFRLFADSRTNHVSAADYSKCRQIKVDDYYMSYLDQILRLTSANDCQLVLLTAPFALNDVCKGRIMHIDEWAKANNVLHIDLNRDFRLTGIDNDSDYFDRTHLNVIGSEKASRYIGRKLAEKQTLSPHRGETNVVWEAACRRYDWLKENALKMAKRK